MPWMMLSPREVSRVMVPVQGMGSNAEVLRAVQAKLDPITGELEISRELLERVKVALRNWAGGHEQAFKAVVSAAERHH